MCDAILKRRQSLSREGELEQFADSGVIGRIGEDDRRCVVFIKRAGCAKFRRKVCLFVGRPQRRVAVRCDDIVVARQNVGSVRVSMDRGLFAQSGKISIWISDIPRRYVRQIKL